MNVKRESFSSSGETTRHGRVFRISLPRVGPRATRKTSPRLTRTGQSPSRPGIRSRPGSHSQEDLSNRVEAGASRSPPSARSRTNSPASAQPARAAVRGEMRIPSGPRVSWTSSSSPASSISGFGIRTPREFPIRTIRAFIKPLPQESLLTCKYNVSPTRGRSMFLPGSCVSESGGGGQRRVNMARYQSRRCPSKPPRRFWEDSFPELMSPE